MSDPTLIHIQELLDAAQSSLKTAQSLMRNVTGIADPARERMATRATPAISTASASGRIVEGIFDGQNMVDSQGQTYPVPANYASKSKLVEGDGMKLTITDEGKFIYKQISPAPRRSVMGVLIQEDGQYKVLAEGKPYRVLLASVTFYRADIGDQVSILLPEGQEAKWGAIDAVIPRSLSDANARGALQSDDGELSPTVG